MNLSAKEVINVLNLTPHPTCGLVKMTYTSKIVLPESALPASFAGQRTAGSALYFMVTQKQRVKLHKIKSDQMFHFYVGAPLEVLLFYPNGSSEIKFLGQDFKAGMLPQLFIPAETFHMCKIYGNGEYSLLATSEWIGVDPKNDVVHGDIDQFISAYPSRKNDILRFMEE